MGKRNVLAGFVCGLLALGCDVEVEPGFDYSFDDAEAAAAGLESDDGPLPLTAEGTLAHPSAGWIAVEGPGVEPACGGVLVAPDIALTSTACVAAYDASAVQFGFGRPGATSRVNVESIAVLEFQPRLAALVLDTAVAVEPASATELDADACGVETVTHERVTVGETGDRWIWEGCYEADNATVEPLAGEQGCTAQAGAPTFSRHGDLIGLSVAAIAGDGCAAQITLAHTTAAAYDEALDHSRL